jgi:signal transduction histidine kinase
VRAVAESHGGTVTLQTAEAGSGARFVVRLPTASNLDDDGQHHRSPLETVID